LGQDTCERSSCLHKEILPYWFQTVFKCPYVKKTTKDKCVCLLEYDDCCNTINSTCRNLKKSEDKVVSIETEIKENRELIEKLQTQFKEIEQEAMTIMKVYEDTQVMIKI
jgi:septal ring factor EnvC (AmiA/AmiB activator)